MSVYYNDIDPYCCKVLRKQIHLGNLPEGHVDERDIREVRASDLVGYQHIHLFAGIGVFPLAMVRAGYPIGLRTLTGGFPCQDISNAGKREGITGERSGLWKEMYRLIQETLAGSLGYDYIILENVSALINRGLSTVLGDLAQARFNAEWRSLRASDFGAPHQRERVFIVAYPMRKRLTSIRNGLSTWKDNTTSPSSTSHVAYSTSGRETTVQQPGQLCSTESSGETVAHTTIKRLSLTRHTQLTENATQAKAGMESQPEQYGNVANSINTRSTNTWDINDTQISRGQESRRQQNTNHAGRSNQSSTSAGAAQPILGRDIDGTPSWLDRYQWPARPGEQQYDWEPSRVTTGKQPHRVARLKALGNAIVLACAERVVRDIVAHAAEVEAVS